MIKKHLLSMSMTLSLFGDSKVRIRTRDRIRIIFPLFLALLIKQVWFILQIVLMF